MATITDAVSLTIEEKIVPTIFEALWGLDPIYPMFSRSWENVKNTGIGRGWQILKTFSTGVAGGAKFQSVAGSDVVSGDHYNVYGTPQSFQGIDETSNVGFHQAAVSLIEHRGNFYLPHQMMRSDQLNSSIGSVVAQNLSGVADLLAQQETSLFYSSSATTGQLAVIVNTSGAMSDAVAPVTTPTAVMVLDLSSATDATGRVHRFRQGMLVDFYDSTGVTKRNTGFSVAVDNIDPIDNKVYFRRVDNATFQVATTLGGGVTYGGAGGDNDIIVIKDSVNQTPKCLESWIADGSTVTSWFGIDVRQYGQYKSYVPSAISAALTENVLNKHVAKFFESFPGKKLDCFLTTMGVINGFLDNIDSGVQAASAVASGRNRYDRNGQALTVEAGWEALRYRFASRPIDIFTSTYCNSGTLYAGRFKNGAVTRYVPPPIPGAKVDSRFGQEVEFIAPIGQAGGYQGIFKIAHSSAGQTTNFLEAPFLRQWNVMPKQANFMKLGTITEVLG